MNVVIAIGLALITAFLAFLAFLKPSDIGAWLQGFGIVAVLALMAIGERRRRHGRSLWSGVSPRVVGYWNVGLGVFFTAIGVILLTKESYINGGFNFLCGLGLLALGFFSLAVLPNSTIERDASKSGSRPSS
jgi:hypothetical protein